MWIAWNTAQNWVNNLQDACVLVECDSCLCTCTPHTSLLSFSHWNVAANWSTVRPFNWLYPFEIEMKTEKECLFAVNTRWEHCKLFTLDQSIWFSVDPGNLLRLSKCSTRNRKQQNNERKQDQRQTVSPGWLMSATIKRMLRF